jgi:hypothetical protein
LVEIPGVDYSYDPPSASGLASAGKKFAVRYGAVGNSAKWLKTSEVTALRAAGIAIVANVEETAQAFRGADTGVRHAKAGDAFFRGLGMPADRPIYFSVDWDATSADWPAVDAALRGAASVIGPDRVGVYGGYDVIAHCATAKTARWFWQTYAWSGGRWYPGCHMQQYKNNITLAGGTVDLDRGMTADFGQWGAGVATSQNGWTVDTSGTMQDRGDIYPGITAPNGIRKGDVAVVLRYLAERFHREVEPLRAGWCWGWYVKVIEGSTATSNHASGTAVDLNAPDHPVGAVDTFSAAKQDAIHRILSDLGGVVRWGGDYSGRHDDMHFEINDDAAAVKTQADKIRGITQEDDVTPEDIAAIAKAVWTYGLEDPLSTSTPKGIKAAGTYQRYADRIAVQAADRAIAALAPTLATMRSEDAARDAATAALVGQLSEMVRAGGGNVDVTAVLNRLDTLRTQIADEAASAGLRASEEVLTRLREAVDRAATPPDPTG